MITEAVVKIRPLPPTKRYGSIVFPDFASGVGCMREIAKQRCQPSSIRLMDNEQFKFGHSLRSPGGWMSSLSSAAKQFYLTKFKGLDLDQICVATLLFEGLNHNNLVLSLICDVNKIIHISFHFRSEKRG